jgi:hypothetical protein
MLRAHVLDCLLIIYKVAISHHRDPFSIVALDILEEG